jgi:spore coat protein JB
MMVRGDRLELLKQLQAMEFTALDLNLYLDTHPGDQRALLEYTNTVRDLESIRQAYIQWSGPLGPSDNSDPSCWRWVEEPWPWEIEY